jgi:hypothetical protein
MRFRDYLPLLLLALAAALRLYQLDGIDVRFDEASAPQQALAIARGQLQAVAYHSGSVVNHPPLYLYLLALPYLFTRDFLAIAAYRQLLDVAAVALTWLLARRFFNPRVAFVAALLFAIAPWAIQLSRKLGIVTPPLFTVIWLWGVCMLLLKRDSRGFALTGFGLALCLGTHLSSVYLIPVTAAVVLLGWRTLTWRSALAGALPLLALALTYLGQDAARGYPNLRALTVGNAASSAASANGGILDNLALRMALWTTGGAHVSDLTSIAYPVWITQAPEFLTHIDTLQMTLVLLSLGALALAAWRQRRSEHARFYIALVVWQVLPVLIQMCGAQAAQVHYSMPLWPGAWLAVAIVVDKVLRSTHAAPRNTQRRDKPEVNEAKFAIQLLLVCLLVVIAGWQIYTTPRFASFIETHDTAGGHGDPVRAGLTAARTAAAAVRDGRYDDVIIVAPRDNPLTDEPATVLDVLLADTPKRFLRDDSGPILRSRPTQYLFSPDTSEAARAAFLSGARTGTIELQRFETRSGGERAYRLVHVPALAPPEMQPAEARWANGAKLIGYQATRSPEDRLLPVTLFLEIERTGSPEQHWFVRVQDASGAQLGAQDIPGISTSQWRVGDVLTFKFDIPVASGTPASLRVGSYAYPEIVQTRVLDSAGNPADDGVTVSIPSR